MGEMAQTLKALGSIRDAWITKNPNGTWGFTGRMDARLRYIKDDGSAPTIEEIKKISSSQFPGMIAKTLHIKIRVFASRETAIEAAKSIGQDWKEPIEGN